MEVNPIGQCFFNMLLGASVESYYLRQYYHSTLCEARVSAWKYRDEKIHEYTGAFLHSIYGCV